MPEKKVTRVEFPDTTTGTAKAPPKKRVVAYARVSTMKDAQENSLDAQRDILSATSNGTRIGFLPGYTPMTASPGCLSASVTALTK